MGLQVEGPGEEEEEPANEVMKDQGGEDPGR